MTKQQIGVRVLILLVIIGVLVYWGNRNENIVASRNEVSTEASQKDVNQETEQKKDEESASEVYPIDILNTSYTVGERSVLLTNGTSLLPTALDSESTMRVSVLNGPAFADMDGDGVKDGAVILRDEPGGSGIFYYLAIALSNNGSIRTTNSILLGDRIRIQEIEIQGGGVVHVTTLDRNKTDPMTTAPRVEVKKTFQLTEGTLVQTN
jgi:hypothetical protein